jgi:hypothetical protein
LKKSSPENFTVTTTGVEDSGVNGILLEAVAGKAMDSIWFESGLND